MENTYDQLLKEYNQLLELNERMDPLRELVNNADMDPEAFMCRVKEEVSKLEDVLHSPLARKYYPIIDKMLSMTKEKFKTYMNTPIKYYPYSFPFPENTKELQLPMVFADERIYNKLYEGEVDGESKDTN